MQIRQISNGFIVGDGCSSEDFCNTSYKAAIVACQRIMGGSFDYDKFHEALNDMGDLLWEPKSCRGKP